MKQSIFLAILLAACLCECLDLGEIKSLVVVNDPDMNRNVSELISSKGYPVEEHTVQTADGFLLGMQRIPYDKNGRWKDTKNKPVVFLQHGLISASSDWVFNFPHQSLGFLLADSGYDVWLGNNRGNTYSRHHVKYTPDQLEFWDYSFDEMAKYDLPAMFGYVLNSTSQEQLYYIGFSQGTSILFALLSDYPEWNEKIKLFIALAPVTTVGYIKSFIRYLAPYSYEIERLYLLLGTKGEFLPSKGLVKLFAKAVCATGVRDTCSQIIFSVFGYDEYQLNKTRIGVYAAHTPAGTSIKSIAHYGQLVNSNLFTKYNYGSAENMKRFNQTTPPEYDVTRITTPVALLWADEDYLADPTDVDNLKKKIEGKSLVSSYRVPFHHFNHGDFVLALHANRLVYEEVFKLLKKY